MSPPAFPDSVKGYFLFCFLLAIPIWGWGDEKVPLLVIIDTGVCPSHITPENGKLGEAFDLDVGWDFVAGELNYEDEAGHGTHMSGIIWRQLQGLSRKSGKMDGHPPSLCMMRTGVERLDSGHLVDALKRIETYLESGREVPVILCAFSLEQRNAKSEVYEEFEKRLRGLLDRGVVIVSATNGAGDNLDALSEERSFLPGCLEHPNLYTIAACSDRGFPAPRASSGKTRIFASAVGRNVQSLWPQGEERKLSGSSQASALVAAEAYHLLTRKEEPVPVAGLRAALTQRGELHPSLLGRTETGRYFTPVSENKEESASGNQPE